MQAPFWHVRSAPHDLPFGTAACWQPSVASQVSSVHGLRSSHTSGTPDVHRPARHTSSPLHTVASAQEAPSVA